MPTSRSAAVRQVEEDEEEETDMTTQPSSPRSAAGRQGTTRRTAAPQSSSRRRWLAAAVMTPLLAGCATSFGAQTNQIYQPGPGISDRGSDVYVMNAAIVTDGKGNGTLVGALINQNPRTDTLRSITVLDSNGKAISASILPGTISLPDQRSVQLADSGDVRVSGNVHAGVNDTLTLTFANAAPVTMTIPVLPRTSEFHSVPVGPTSTPTTPSHSNP